MYDIYTAYFFDVQPLQLLGHEWSGLVIDQLLAASLWC